MDEHCISLISKSVKEEVRDSAGDLAADLIARLLHPNPNERIESMSKVLQHKYFHEEALEDAYKEVKATERDDEVKGFRKRSRSRKRR